MLNAIWFQKFWTERDYGDRPFNSVTSFLDADTESLIPEGR